MDEDRHNMADMTFAEHVDLKQITPTVVARTYTHTYTHVHYHIHIHTKHTLK